MRRNLRMDLVLTKERCSGSWIPCTMENWAPGSLFELAKITRRWNEASSPIRTGETVLLLNQVNNEDRVQSPGEC